MWVIKEAYRMREKRKSETGVRLWDLMRRKRNVMAKISKARAKIITLPPQRKYSEISELKKMVARVAAMATVSLKKVRRKW